MVEGFNLVEEVLDSNFMKRLIITVLISMLSNLAMCQYLGGEYGGFERFKGVFTNCSFFYGGDGSGSYKKGLDEFVTCFMFAGGGKGGYLGIRESDSTNCIMFAGGIYSGDKAEFYVSPFACLFYRSSEQLGRGDHARKRSDFEEVCVIIPLSISVSPLTGEVKNYNGVLSWSTYNETELEGFEVYKSLDGQDWKLIDNVPSKGDNFGTNNYSATDYAMSAQNNYYKIKIRHLSGIYLFSNIVVLNWSEQAVNKDIFAVYPNPSLIGNDVVIKSWTQKDWDVTVQVIDFLGRTMLDKVANFSKGNDALILHTSAFSSGIYTISITSNEDKTKLSIPLIVVD